MAAGGLTTMQLSERLGVTYRQLDYLARTVLEDGDLAGAAGSGSRRRWPPDVVERLEAATAHARALGWDGGPGNQLWARLARAALSSPALI